MNSGIDHSYDFVSTKEIMFTCPDDQGKEINITIHVSKTNGEEITPVVKKRIAAGIELMSGGAIPAKESIAIIDSPPTPFERLMSP